MVPPPILDQFAPSLAWSAARLLCFCLAAPLAELFFWETSPRPILKPVRLPQHQASRLEPGKRLERAGAVAEWAVPAASTRSCQALPGSLLKRGQAVPLPYWHGDPQDLKPPATLSAERKALSGNTPLKLQQPQLPRR